MNENNKNMGGVYGSEKFLNETHLLLEKQSKLVFDVFQKIKNSSNELNIGVGTLTFSIVDSCQSLLILTQNRRLRDAYVCARTILEIILNIGFFAAKGKSSIEKAMNYAKQKSYRDLNRKLEIGDIYIMFGLKGFDDIPIDEELKKCIDEYTSQKGHEVRSWTGENTFNKIKIISEKYGKDLGTVLGLSLFNIYRHSSEIAHGTLFGEFFIMGVTAVGSDKPNNYDDVIKYQIRHLTLINLSVFLAIETTLIILQDHYNIKQEIDESRKLLSSFKNKFFKKK